MVAFHSLEDRMVKEAFRNWARSCRCPRERAACECEGRPLVRLLTKKALRPSPDEVERNPRSRSARLRAVEKLEPINLAGATALFLPGLRGPGGDLAGFNPERE